MSVRISSDATGLSRSTDTIDATAFSISMWVRVLVAATGGANGTFFDWFDNGAGTSEVRLSENTGQFFLSLGWGTAFQDFFFTYTLGAWYYVAMTGSATSGVHTYYWSGDNGVGPLNVKSTTKTGTQTLYTLSGYGRFGAGLTGGPLNGDLACVKIWSGAVLSQAEIQNEMMQGPPQRQTNLYAFYPLWTANGSQHLIDCGGQRRDLSGNGTSPDSDLAGPPVAWV